MVEKAETFVRDNPFIEFRLDYLARPLLALPKLKKHLQVAQRLQSMLQGGRKAVWAAEAWPFRVIYICARKHRARRSLARALQDQRSTSSSVTWRALARSSSKERSSFRTSALS